LHACRCIQGVHLASDFFDCRRDVCDADWGPIAHAQERHLQAKTGRHQTACVCVAAQLRVMCAKHVSSLPTSLVYLKSSALWVLVDPHWQGQWHVPSTASHCGRPLIQLVAENIHIHIPAQSAAFKCHQCKLAHTDIDRLQGSDREASRMSSLFVSLR
jgi:hypothetical protein